MSDTRPTSPPRVRRGRRDRLDNLALVPANFLPFKEQWQQVANVLPDGDALFLVPISDSPLRRSMMKVAAQWRSRGRHVMTVDAQYFSS